MTGIANILRSYLHVRDGGTSTPLPVSGSFWQELGDGAHPELDHGRLLSAFTFAEPWSTWERHPAGEELVMLLSGQATLLLDAQGKLRRETLRAAGDYVLVPANTWHTAHASEPTTLLFLTPGAGTEHRPVAETDHMENAE